MKNARLVISLLVNIAVMVATLLTGWVGALGLEIQNWWWLVVAIVLNIFGAFISNAIKNPTGGSKALDMLQDIYDTLDAQKEAIESSTKLIELQAKEIELLNKEIT